MIAMIVGRLLGSSSFKYNLAAVRGVKARTILFEWSACRL